MNMSNKKYYITTAIPYVNAKPHIGFALELVQSDVIARMHRAQGYDVFFLTGTDDNSLKNVQAAEKAGQSTKEFVDANAQIFRDLTDVLTISNDHFVRTAQHDHFAGAQKLWSACKPEDIYKKKYAGLYCVGCELFYSESELVDGKCPEHKTVPELVEEENYFFKLSNYQEQLASLIESDAYTIVPSSRKKEILSFIKMGLEDFSISRSVARAKNWGVPVPGDPSQIMYVWFDALSNYITALGYGSDEKKFNRYWPADLHVIGKGIIRFHAVYWPAMLLSAELVLPKKLFVHGYINVAGEKMSKSLGNVIDPFELTRTYGTEAVRWYLLKHMHPFEDSDFFEEKFIESYNADLANGLGNLLSRVTNMVQKYGVTITTPAFSHDTAFEQRISGYIADLHFRDALLEVWKKIAEANQTIDREKPWTIAESDPATLQKLLQQLVLDLYDIQLALEPFMPATSKKIHEVITANPIVKSEPLFGRL